MGYKNNNFILGMHIVPHAVNRGLSYSLATERLNTYKLCYAICALVGCD
jgi:hypothetical protein